jgi:hypothetical protein
MTISGIMHSVVSQKLAYDSVVPDAFTIVMMIKAIRTSETSVNF